MYKVELFFIIVLVVVGGYVLRKGCNQLENRSNQLQEVRTWLDSQK